MTSHDCTTKSVEVGSSPLYGPLRRCKVCRQYWVVHSDRLWEDEEVSPGNISPKYDGVSTGYSPVFHGPGELGLANSILLGCTLTQSALEQAQGYNERTIRDDERIKND